MSKQSSPDRVSHILTTLNQYKAYWILPAIAGMMLAAVYAIALKQETWSAKQSLKLRDDLLGESFKPGQFNSAESMKSAQETIFEIARQPQVIRNALKELGPPSRGLFGLGANSYPSEETIENIQGAVSFSAPNGAEFGKTEVIILNSKASTRERSKRFIDLLVLEIIAKVNEVRHRKFQSMEIELRQTCKSAEDSLEKSKVELREMYRLLGQDAGGMSAIGDSAVRDDPIKKEIAQLNLERRAVQSEIESGKSILAGLAVAKQDPKAIVNISSDLTERQPELNSLKQELVKRKGEFAVLSGRYTTAHPMVASATDAIQTMEGQIRLVLDNAVRDIESQNAIQLARLERLETDIKDLRDRLFNLSDKQADSMTLVADVENKTQILNNARKGLAQINSLASAVDADLLIRVGEAQVSTRPDGLGKKQLVLCGGLGGLMLGLGLVMLVAPSITNEPFDGSIDRRQADSTVSSVVSRNHASEPGSASQEFSQEDSADENETLNPAFSDLGLSNLKPVDWSDVEEELDSQPATHSEPIHSEPIHLPIPRTFADESTELQEDEPVSTVGLSQEILTSSEVIAVTNDSPVDEPPRKTTISTAFESDQEVEQNKDLVDIDQLVESLNESSETGRSHPESVSPISEGMQIEATKADAETKEAQLADEDPSIDPAILAASIRKAYGKPPVEIPEIEHPTATEEMVDRAFEDEFKSMNKSESQTIQMDALAKAINSEFEAKNSFDIPTVDVSPVAPETHAEPKSTGESPAPEETSESKPRRGIQIKPRTSNARPVDLLKSVNGDQTLVRLSGASQDGHTAENKSTDKSSQESESDRSGMSVGSDQSKQIRMNVETAIVPVPDQVQRLRDSISNFARPLTKPDEDENSEF